MYGTYTHDRGGILKRLTFNKRSLKENGEKTLGKA
jgi:hypothetical protein